MNENSTPNNSKKKLTFRQVAEKIIALNDIEKEHVYEALYQKLCEKIGENWHIAAGSKIYARKKSGYTEFIMQQGSTKVSLFKIQQISSDSRGNISIVPAEVSCKESLESSNHYYTGNDLFEFATDSLFRFGTEEALPISNNLLYGHVIVLNLNGFRQTEAES